MWMWILTGVGWAADCTVQEEDGTSVLFYKEAAAKAVRLDGRWVRLEGGQLPADVTLEPGVTLSAKDEFGIIVTCTLAATSPERPDPPDPLPPSPGFDWCDSEIRALAGIEPAHSPYFLCVDAAGDAYRTLLKTWRQPDPDAAAELVPHHDVYLQPYRSVWVLTRRAADRTLTVAAQGPIATGQPGEWELDQKTADVATPPLVIDRHLTAPRVPGQAYTIALGLSKESTPKTDPAADEAPDPDDASDEPEAPPEETTESLWSNSVELVPLAAYRGALRLGMGVGLSPWSYELGAEPVDGGEQLVVTPTVVRPFELVVAYAPYRGGKPLTWHPDRQTMKDRRINPYMGIGVARVTTEPDKTLPVELFTSAHLGLEFAFSPNASVALTASLFRQDKPRADLAHGDVVASVDDSLVPTIRPALNWVINFHPQVFVNAEKLATGTSLSDLLGGDDAGDDDDGETPDEEGGE